VSRSSPSPEHSPDHPSSRSEIISVYAAGVVQGIGLVTFPAAGAILTSSAHYGLGTSAYGMLFLPQALMAILSSLFGERISSLLGGPRRVFLFGILFNALSMVLLLSSQFLIGHKGITYPLLMIATTCMGLAFGLTVPAINTFAAGFFPRAVDRALLALNTLLGLGTALAPVIVSLFLGFGIWWGLPLSVLILSFLLFLFTLPLPLKGKEVSAESSPLLKKESSKPVCQTQSHVFLIFAAAALVYGICETMNGNWASILVAQGLDGGMAAGSLALTCFWGTVTGGRLLFATIDRWIPGRVVFRLLPAVITAAFLLIFLLRKGDADDGVAVFALAGFGCSAMLPLIISLGQTRMPVIANSVAGSMIAWYQIGYGIAAFAVGPIEEYLHLPLTRILGGSALLGFLLLILAVPASGRKPAEA
jgi:MFS family permease